MSKTRVSSGPLAAHGGDLADAMALAGEPDGNPKDWLDLSTGLNPHPYPVPPLDNAVWTRLPGRCALESLIDAATAYYGAPSADHIVAGPGSQALIQALPRLLPAASVAIVGPTYGAHAPAWKAAGHAVREVARLEDTDTAETVVLVNPNNPDGRLVSLNDLAAEAERRERRTGTLVIDEAFGDVVQEAGAAGLARDRGVVVLKSFSKFFGLGGVRLGFAIAPPELAGALRTALGPWAVSGPALAIGAAALADTAWHEEQRGRLAHAAQRLDEALGGAGLRVIGGTSLYRLVESEQAPALFAHLLERRIYVRRFAYDPRWLRLGLPGCDDAMARLDEALRALGA